MAWLAILAYAIRPHLTLADAAAPANVQILLLQVLGIGAVVLIPSLLYLFGISWGTWASHWKGLRALEHGPISVMRL